MHPKRDIQRLNLRREINFRLRLLQKRMVESIVEFHYAEGRIAALPKGLAMPPPWALDAARRVGKLCLKEPSQEETKRDPRGTVQQAIGMYEGVLAYLAQPFGKESDDELAREAIQKLHKFTSRIFSRKSLQALRKYDSAMERILPRVTPQQLIDHNRRRRQGIEAIVDADGELQVLPTKQAEIYYVICLFWPEVAKLLPTLTAERLQSWLGNSVGIFTSTETVEIVFTRLKLASFKVERRKST